MSRSPVAQLWLAAAFWLAFALPAVWLARGGIAFDTDSAMRLAEVRDLLHGQSWFDTTQWRMNVPFGLPMHWSRLVDAPIAALIALSRSETFAVTVWPLFLLFATMAALARAAERLAGAKAAVAVLILTLLAAELYGQFVPGNIDHHNVQLALAAWLLVFLVEQRPAAAAAAIALALGVGLESLPYCALAVAAGLLWLKSDPPRARIFGLTLAATAPVLLFATTAARYRFAPACDTYSLFYALLLAAGGAGIAAISHLKRGRGVAVAALGIALLVLAGLLNPVCFGGPYAGLDPRLKLLFFARINEAKPAAAFALFAPSEFVRGYIYACFAFLVCFLAPVGRTRALVIAMTGTALLVSSFEIRAVPFAVLFALPGLAGALVRLRPVPLTLALILGNGAAFAMAGGLLEGPSRLTARIEAFRAQEACGSKAAMEPLRALAKGRVAGFVDQGPAILVYSPDSAIAGPYHRDGAGIIDTDAIFAGPDPRAVLNARGIDYLMTCTAAPDWRFYRARGGLVASLAAHRVPAWLNPVGASGAVSVYRVAKSQSAVQ
jgi:hypothetical protein